MSLCGKIVVVEKKRKVNRKRQRTDDDSSDDNADDDSISPLSYTYTNCDSSEMLQEMEQQQLESPLMYYPSQNSTIRVDDYDEDCNDDDSTLGLQRQPPVFRWLTWRMDPIKSFSDWMIDVFIENRTNTGSNISTRRQPQAATVQLPSMNLDSRDVHLDAIDEDDINTVTLTPHRQRYHVHKNILVVESHFFQALFHQRPPTPATTSTATTVTVPLASSTNTMEITLSNEFEGQVFATFLDYMYSPGSVWINSHNACTMLRLAKYFRMKRLQWLCKQFLKLEESRKQQDPEGPNHSYVTTVVSPNLLSSFEQRMNNLSRMVQSSNDTTGSLPLNNSAIAAITAAVAAVPKDPPDRITVASTTLLDPVTTIDTATSTTTTSRPLKLHSTVITAYHHSNNINHNHISTNSSTTTTSGHATTTGTTTTKPSTGKSNDEVFYQ